MNKVIIFAVSKILQFIRMYNKKSYWLFKTIGLLLLFVPVIPLRAQYHAMYQFRVEYMYGMLLKHDQHMEALVDKPAMGAELSVDFLPNGKQQWPFLWNGASVGAALAYVNLGNPNVLGHAIALYPYVNIPILRLSWLCVSVKPGVGLGFVTKTFGNTAPPGTTSLANPDGTINTAVGSVVNACLRGTLAFEVPVYKGFGITGGIGYLHLSNGSIKTPNSGLNMLSAQLGCVYFPQYDIYNRIYVPRVRQPMDKRFSYELTLSGGVRELYYQDNRMYGIASAAFSVHYPLARIFRLGIGADAFYDGVFGAVNADYATGNEPVTNYARTYITSSELKNQFRVGVSLQPELIFGRLIAGVHLGVYLYDPIKNLEPFADAKNGTVKKGIFYKYDINKEDGWFYTRLGLKYLITDYFYVAVGLKTHLQKAEFIEWGVGVRL